MWYGWVTDDDAVEQASRVPVVVVVEFDFGRQLVSAIELGEAINMLRSFRQVSNDNNAGCHLGSSG
jgi:hypothetical protein